MGENLRKGQCDAFKKGVDQSRTEIAVPHFFERPDKEWFRHDADLLDGKIVAVCDTLFAQQSGDSPIIVLSKGSEPVATIENEGAIKLIKILEATDCPGFAQVTVVDVCDISDSITVQLFDDGKDDG